MFQRTSFSLKAEVRDSLTKEPIAFASVYLHHPKDTVITNFALTDTLGKVEIKEIARGDHKVCVEYMGYKPYLKTFYINKDMEIPVIDLQPDPNFLEAAKVTAIMNPVEFRQDTIIYNAAAFHTLSTDNLAALLRKMPGVEVEKDGTVKVNGKAVDRITVNGKTFFMGDNKAALDNLPAKVVDKIKVMDKDSKSSGFSGIKDTDKEKVMDVELKEEYKKGFFGNVKVGGGTSIPGKDDNEYIEHKDVLFNSSAMLSAYGEKDQMTLIGSAKNYNDPGAGAVIVFSDISEMTSAQIDLGSGITSNWQIGSNINSDRIKGMETTASVSLTGSRNDIRNRSDRTTWQSMGDLFDTSRNIQDIDSRRFIGHLLFENKDKKKYNFYLETSMNYGHTTSNSDGSSSSSLNGMEMNRATSHSMAYSRSLNVGLSSSFGIKELGGNSRRSLTFNAEISGSTKDGRSSDFSDTWYAASGTNTVRDLLYDNDGCGRSMSAEIGYVEPLAENLAARITDKVSYSSSSDTKEATNGSDGSYNSYYSSYTRNNYLSNLSSLLLQYNKGRTNIQAGARLNMYKNETFAHSFEMDTETGVDVWETVVSPYINANVPIGDKTSFNLYVNFNTQKPSASNITPAFNIINPTRITAGNIYLKPATSTSTTFTINGFGKISWNFYILGSINSNQPVSAIWFDESSIRYSVPVNTRKPSGIANTYLYLRLPVTKNGKLSLSYTSNLNYTVTTSYQSKGIFSGIDIDTFNYFDFMSDFWGDDASGANFYSGKSGFQESSTNQTSISQNFVITWKPDHFDINLSSYFRNSKSRYSLDPRANTNTWNNSFSLNVTYITSGGFELGTDWDYNIRRGFGSGYNYNLMDWNLKIGKNIRSVTVSLLANDLLNNARSLRHSITENYVQDSYSNLLGRTVVLSFAWNFGKMNTSKSQAAQNALWNMVM